MQQIDLDKPEVAEYEVEDFYYEDDLNQGVSMEMLANGADLVSSNPSEKSKNCLFYLAQTGDSETLELLLNSVTVGLEVIHDSNGATPLHYAANHLTAKVLLKEYADPDFFDSKGYSPLMVFLNQACIGYDNWLSNEENQALKSAIDCFNRSRIENYAGWQKNYIFSLISRPPFYDLLRHHPNAQYLAECVYLESGELFCNQDGKEMSLIDGDIKLKTAEEIGVLLSNAEAARKALYKDYDLEKEEKLKSAKALEEIKRKLEPGSIHVTYAQNGKTNWILTGALWLLNPFLEDEDRQYCSHHLAYYGNIDAMEAIVDEMSNDGEVDIFLNKANIHKISPLHIAAYRGNFEMVNFLLEKDVDLYQFDYENQSPLHLAIYGFLNCDDEVAREFYIGSINSLMKKYELDILDIKDRAGNSPLELILKNDMLRARFGEHDLIKSYQAKILEEEEHHQEIDIEIERLGMEAQDRESSLYNEQIRGDERKSSAEMAIMRQEDSFSKEYEDSLSKELARTVASSSTSFSEAEPAVSIKTLKARQRKAEAQQKKLKEERDKLERLRIENELKDVGLDNLKSGVFEIKSGLEAEWRLDILGKNLAEVLREAGIIEIRKFFDYFEDKKHILVMALAEHQFHDPRLLLAIVNSFDFEKIGGSEFLNRSISVALERFKTRPIEEYSEPNKLNLINSLAFIKVLSCKIKHNEDSRRLISEFFDYLKIPSSNIDSKKFLEDKDSNCADIFKYVGFLPEKGSRPSKYHSLLVIILSSIHGLFDEKDKDLFAFLLKNFLSQDRADDRKRNPFSPFALELFKAKLGTNLQDFVSLPSIAAETNNVLLEYLLDEGCLVNAASANNYDQPLWCAVRGGILDNIKLLKNRGADIEKCPGIEKLINETYMPSSAQKIKEILRPPRSSLDISAVEKVSSNRKSK